MISALFCVFRASGQDPHGIKQIRALYNQKINFEHFEIDLARLIPGRGEREGNLTFLYLDCHTNDCSEFGIADDIQV